MGCFYHRIASPVVFTTGLTLQHLYAVLEADYD